VGRSVRGMLVLLSTLAALAGCSGDDPTDVVATPPTDEGASAPTATSGEPTETGGTPSATAPEDAGPRVTADDQPVVDGTVSVAVAAVPGPAFVVLHRDEGGAPGPVVGHAEVDAGDHEAVRVTLDEDVSDGATLWAMLHTDAGERGVYEFPGPDVPLRDVEDAVVMVPFVVTAP
jgi:hypothetical protein